MPFEITRPLETLRAQATARINARAEEIIKARLPQWKQANLTARAVELNHRAVGLWTQAETAEWGAIQAEWEWVKSVRAASNVATDAVASADSPAAVYSAVKTFLSMG
ncbi:hypothetical protein [Methylomicrobium lacus]|uniref:hypothetical protein n=1 Tax=Methylomicrobium lacus TaxID=136992 RepID=UPI00045E82E8|nr:hypothetical protein [Methylomicrobium lacus]